MPVITELLARLGVDPRDFQKNLKKAETVLQKSANKMLSIGRDLSIGVTAPITGIGAVATKSFASFDDALTKSAAILQGAEGRMDDLAAAAREVGKTTTFSATQAAEAFFFLASAGFDAEQSIDALVPVTTFAAAGTFDLATATDLLTDAQSALGLKSKDAATNIANLVKVSDALVGANTLANATTRQFSEALTAGAAAAGRVAGLELNEIVAVLAAYADQGIKGADASTKFRVALRDLQTKALENADAFRQLGIEVFEEGGALRKLADIIRDVERRFVGMEARQKKATFQQLNFADKSSQALLTLIGFSGQIDEYNRRLNNLGGITQRVADKNLSSFSAKMKILQGQAEDVAITLGGELAKIIEEVVVPVIQDVIKVVGGVVEGFSRLDEETKRTIVGAVALVAAIGPAVLAFGGLLKVLTAIAGILLSPAFALITVGGALVIGLAKLASNSLKSADALDAMEGKMVGATKAMQDAADAGRTLVEQLEFIQLRGRQTKIDLITKEINNLRDALKSKDIDKLSLPQLLEAKKRMEELRTTQARLRTELRDLAASFADQDLGSKIVGPEVEEGGGAGFLDKLKSGFTELGDRARTVFGGMAEVATIAAQRTGENFGAVFEGFTEKLTAFQEQANATWNSWLETSQDVISNVQIATVEFLESFSAGFGDAIARIVVFQEDFQEVFKGFLKNLLAQVVSTLTQIVVQWVLSTILQAVIGTAGHIQRVGQALQLIYLNAFAATAIIPVVGPAIAPGVASLAVATAGAKSVGAAALGPAIGGAGSASLGLDTGGFITSDGLAFLHRGEVVATPDEVKEVMTGDGRGALDLTINLDGRMIARRVIEHIPREVNLRGA